jgi:predicted nucleotidyltransferase component of viral defense system
MIDVIRAKLQKFNTNVEKYNFLREYLQLLILKVLDEKGYFRNLAFVGGTALRILYDLNRFSEDLDFCLVSKDNYDFAKIIQELEKELRHYNMIVSTRWKSVKTVASAFIKFDGLLFELGLSPHKDKKLLIKFEVDQNPPGGFVTEFTMINKEFLIGINHFDLPSLFSGKLHAFLFRKYPKGRNYYDFIWYVTRNIKPNLYLLNQAILQMEGEELNLDEAKLKKLLLKKAEETDFNKVRLDVEPFLADGNEIRHFNKEFFLDLIKKEF